MTAAVQTRTGIRLPARLLRLLRDLVVGTLLCLTPLTSLIALGWLTRRMNTTLRRRWGDDAPLPGWLLGPPDRGRIAYWLGGLAANIRAGAMTLTGLAIWTLPFSLAWLGAWWAGWENSFNKGYEQAAVGPIVWLIATALGAAILTLLPIALAHAAAERRLGAFVELRRIRSVAAAAGWRLLWLAAVSLVFCVPLFGMRALPVFIEGIVPGFADMTAAEQGNVASAFALAASALAFTILLILRPMAARLYARAAPVAARGRQADLWFGHPAARVTANRLPPLRLLSAFWLLLSYLTWVGLAVLIVFGQFMNYAPALWLTHPLFLLPWFP